MMKLMMMVSMVVMTGQFANAADAKTIAECLRIESESGLCEKHQYDVNKVKTEYKCDEIVERLTRRFYHGHVHHDMVSACVANSSRFLSQFDQLMGKRQSCIDQIKNVTIVKKNVLLPTWYPEYEDVVYKPFKNEVELDYDNTINPEVTSSPCVSESLYVSAAEVGWVSIIKNPDQFLGAAIAELSERTNAAVSLSKECLKHVIVDKPKAYDYLYGQTLNGYLRGYSSSMYDYCNRRTAGFKKSYNFGFLNCVDDMRNSGYESEEASRACDRAYPNP